MRLSKASSGSTGIGVPNNKAKIKLSPQLLYYRTGPPNVELAPWIKTLLDQVHVYPKLYCAILVDLVPTV